MNLADTYAFTGTVTGAGGVMTPAFSVYLSGNVSISQQTYTKLKDRNDQLNKIKKRYDRIQKSKEDDKKTDLNPVDKVKKANPVGMIANKVKSAIGDAGAEFNKQMKQAAADAEKGKLPEPEETDENVMNNKNLLEFRMAVRKRLIRELLENEPPAPDGDAGSGKKGMDPEIAKAINKELEGQTVKSKSGREIKVTSALNPSYKEKEPATYKKAQAIFKKTAQDFFAKGQRAKQGGKPPTSPDDLKKKPQPKQKPDSVDQKPDVKKPQKKEPKVKKPVAQMSKEELQTRYKETQEKTKKADELFNRADALVKRDPRDVGAVAARQEASNRRFDAKAEQATAAMDVLSKINEQKDQIKKEHPNPFSKERREKLKALREEKRQAFEESGMSEKDVVRTLAKKAIKDKYDAALDPTKNTGAPTVFSMDKEGGPAQVELGGTKIDPDTGELNVEVYELDDDGNKLTDNDGNYLSNTIPETDLKPSEEAEKAPTDTEDETEDKWPNREDVKNGLYDFFSDQFDFSDTIDIAAELGLELETGGL
jgi:ferredoxin